MNNNIVITGQGIISAIGVGKEAVLRSLCEGRTGIGTMKHLNSIHHELPVGEVNLSNDEMKTILGIDRSTEISRTALLGMIALQQAIDESGITTLRQVSTDKHIILISGTTVGGMDLTEQYFGSFDQDDSHIECMRQHDCGSNTELMANHFGLFDECTTISTACSSAANAIILAANLIKAGQADIVVAGGTEALSRFHLNGFNSLQILDKNVCRPFDDERMGLNLGEGAAFIVLEREDEARQRGADIYGYLTGYGNACDAFHQTASSENGDGAFMAMTTAIEMAGLQPEHINYVNAHGTATPNNDLSESAALKRVFKNQMPPVSSTKCYTGHTTSASGSIEAVISLLAMKHGFVPANLGWNNPMPEGIIPSMGLKNCEINHVLCNSFGFGGNDSSLIFSVSKVAVAYELQIVDEVPSEGHDLKPDAIITATAWGCLDYSERLLKQLQEEGEVLLKPTYFMQSTHNTIGSNIAIRLKCHGYNVTYTHGEESLDWAIRDAKLLIQSGKYKTVLVGVHDEVTPMMRSLMERLGIKVMPSSFYSKAIVMSCGR